MPEKEQRVGIGLPKTNLSGEQLGQKQVEQPSPAVTATPEVTQNEAVPIKQDAVDGKNFEAEEFVAENAPEVAKRKSLWSQMVDLLTPGSAGDIYRKRQEEINSNSEKAA